jgi:peptide deformylase
MAIRPIVYYPDPILLRPTAEVDEIDDDIRILVQDMVETMYDEPGVGLAANQVGVGLRICVIDLSVGEEPDELKVLINPVVLETAGSQYGEEGCLSFPEITLEIERPDEVRVGALDLDGNRYVLDGRGLMARALLHEIEHLDGQVFLRNVSSLKREIVKRQIRKKMKSGDWGVPEKQ